MTRMAPFGRSAIYGYRAYGSVCASWLMYLQNAEVISRLHCTKLLLCNLQGTKMQAFQCCNHCFFEGQLFAKILCWSSGDIWGISPIWCHFAGAESVDLVSRIQWSDCNYHSISSLILDRFNLLVIFTSFFKIPL